MEIIFEIYIVICYSHLVAVPNSPFWYFMRHPDFKKQRLHYEWAHEIKKSLSFLKGFIKQSIIEQTINFLSFSFLINCCISG